MLLINHCIITFTYSIVHRYEAIKKLSINRSIVQIWPNLCFMLSAEK